MTWTEAGLQWLTLSSRPSSRIHDGRWNPLRGPVFFPGLSAC
jgi:hypothetical protein